MSKELTLQQQPSMSDMERMATALAKSGLFGVKTVDQALALMIVALAEGKHPGTIASEYHIIQGKAALRADAMLARFQQSGGKVEWHDHSDTKVAATFSHPQGGSLRVDWDMARAKAAGIDGKENWKKYPRQMLRARVLSEGVRAVFPAVLQGMYTPEEVADFSSAPMPAMPAIESIKTDSPAPKAQAEAIEIEVEPVEPDSDWFDAIEAVMAPHAKKVNAFLRKKDMIGEEQTWKDLPEGSYRDRVCSSVEKFIEAVLK